MFKDFKRVDIELHSHCNRSCPWCPNHYVKTSDAVLSDETFSKVLISLRAGSFQNRINKKDLKFISLNGYSEPLLEPDLLIRRIKEIRDVLPHVDITLNTNGDFLSREILKRLPLQQLSIMDYDNRGAQFWIRKFKNLGIVIVASKKDRLVGTHCGITKVLCKLNFTKNYTLENRGGILPKKIEGHTVTWACNLEERKTHCVEPLHFPVITADGSVMPCCHVRPSTHPDLILGNVNEASLETIFASEHYLKLKELFERGDIKDYPYACRHCHKTRADAFSTNRAALWQDFKGSGHNNNALAVRQIKRVSNGL